MLETLIVTGIISIPEPLFKRGGGLSTFLPFSANPVFPTYKRCDRLLNCEADFIKSYYPIYYNVIPCLLGLNVGKTKKVNSGLNFSKLMAR